MKLKHGKSQPAKNMKSLLLMYDAKPFKRGDLIGYEPCDDVATCQTGDIVIAYADGQKRICKIDNNKLVDMATGIIYDAKTVIGIQKGFFRSDLKNDNPFFAATLKRCFNVDLENF